MVRTAKKPELAASGALPSGGRCDDGMRGVSKTVDKPTSSFDRNRHTLSRRTQESSKIFVPLNPNEQPRNPARGKQMHTDPFATDRTQQPVRRSRHKVQTPRGPARPDRRIMKTVADPHKEATYKEGFVTANGVRHTSPKRTAPARAGTTFHHDQKPKSFDGSRRFASSPYRQRQRAAAAAADSAASSAVPSPSASTVQSTADARAAAIAAVPSLSSIPVAISDVFPAASQSCAAVSAGPSPDRRGGKRVNERMATHVSLQGCIGRPLPNGRAPRPSDQAPWMRETAQRASGRSVAARPASSSAPFAIGA